MKVQTKSGEVEKIANEYNDLMKKGMSNTALYSGDSKKVKVTVDEDIHEVVSKLAEHRNKKATQGVIAYEWLMMYESEFNDMITDFENEIDKKLEKLRIKPELVNQVQWTEKLVLHDDDTKRMNVWIPMRVHKQHDSEHYKQLITEAVEHGYNSIYRDRKERMDVKKELVKYASDDTNKISNSKAEMIINNSEDIDIPNQLLNEIQGYLIGGREDYLNVADNLQSWDKRYKALDDWLSFKKEPFDTVFETVQEAHDLTDEEYLGRKINIFARKYNYDYLVPDKKVKYRQELNISVEDIKGRYLNGNYILEEVVIGYINTRSGLNRIDGNKLLENVKSEFNSISEFEEWIENTTYLTSPSRSTDIIPIKYVRTKNDLTIKQKGTLF